MSFATGLQMGFSNQREAAAQELRMAQEARAQQLHALQVAQMEREARLAREGDAAHEQFGRDFFGTPPAAGAPAAPTGIPMPAAPQMSMAPDAPPRARSGAEFLDRFAPEPGAAPGAGVPQMSRAPEPAAGAGMPEAVKSAPNPFAARRQQLDAKRRYAVASQRGPQLASALTALDQEEKAIQTEEIVARVPELMKNPEYVAGVKQFINDNSDYVSLVESKDPKTGRTSMRAVIINPGVGEKEVQLSPAQLMKIVAGHELLKIGNPEGMRLIGEGNKELADALDKQGSRRLEAGKFNVDAQAKDDQYRHQRAVEANDATRTKAVVDARDAAKWSIVGATDDKKGLLRYNSETGETKVQPLPPGTDAEGLFRKITGAGAPKPVTEEDVNAVVDRLSADPRFKNVPYESLRQKALGILKGAPGGLANPYANPGAAGAGGPSAPPRTVGGIPESPEQAEARRISDMDEATFAAYKAWKENQPTSPLQRQLLQRAGIAP